MAYIRRALVFAGGAAAVVVGLLYSRYAVSRDYTIITERNLFGHPPPEDKAPPAVTKKPEDMQKARLSAVLVGTVLGAAGSSRAVIYDKSTGKQELCEVGDMVQGAVVREILRGKVIVTRNGRNEVLDIADAAALHKNTVPGYTDFAGIRNKGMFPPGPDRRMPLPGPGKVDGISAMPHPPARNAARGSSMNPAPMRKSLPASVIRPPINQ